MRFSPGCSCCTGVPPRFETCSKYTGRGTTATVTRLGGTDADELYVGAVCYEGAGPGTLIPPLGWATLQQLDFNPSDGHLWVGYRKPTAGEPASWTWSLTGYSKIMAAVVGLLEADVPGDSSKNSGTTATMTATSVACGSNTRGFACYACYDSLTVATSDLIVCDAFDATAFAYNIYIATYLPSPTSTGNRTATTVNPTFGWGAVNLVVDMF